MAFSYLLVDRDQQFLLPPDMKDWLERDDLAWFLMDVIEAIDTSELHRRHPNIGVGRRAFDPDVLLAILIYAYCNRERSSRRIARKCRTDIAYRVLCGNQYFPDHTVIARFRQRLGPLMAKLFVEVLRLAYEAGVTSIGVVALDGTKIGGNASIKANRSKDALEREVAEMISQADQTDQREDELYGPDKRGDELPVWAAEPNTRKNRIVRALAVLDEQQACRTPTPTQTQKHEARLKRLEQRLQRATQRLDQQTRADQDVQDRRELAANDPALKAPTGRKPSPGGTTRHKKAKQSYEQASTELDKHRRQPPAGEANTDRVNTTDPDSKIMKTSNGWIQGYNAQAVADTNGIVLAADLTNDPTDTNQYIPMTRAVDENLTAAAIPKRPDLYLADAGYQSKHNLKAPGPDRIIATSKSRDIQKRPATNKPPPQNPDPVEQNRYRLTTLLGKQLYSLRQHTIEPIFGHNKHNLGYRQLTLRGIQNARAEWQLITTAQNLATIWRRTAKTT